MSGVYVYLNGIVKGEGLTPKEGGRVAVKEAKMGVRMTFRY
jgi:hypothetical protein